MKIKVNKRSIKNVGKQICNSAKDLESEKKKIQVLFDELNSAWIGDDADKIIDIVKTVYLPNLNKVCDKMDGLGRYLQSVDRVYDQLDNVYKAKKISK